MFGSDYVVMASLEAIRPVFMIVMGAFLAIIAWRLSKNTGVWTSRFLVSGALLISFGYVFVMPLYAAGIIRPYVPGASHAGGSPDAHAFQVIKLVVMNGGWLLFGLGLALHVRLFQAPLKPLPEAAATVSTHESIA